MYRRDGFWGRKKRIISDAHFVLPAGRACAIIGKNGTGKTTLLRAMAGIVEPEGVVRRARVSYVPERPLFYRHQKVMDALKYVWDLAGRPQVSLDEVMHRFDLERYAGSYVRTLSKGWQQRVSLAQAFMSGGSLLILDEPMSGLDALTRVQVSLMIRAACQAGMSAVIATHVFGEVAWVDQVAFLDQGRLSLSVDSGSLRVGYRALFMDDLEGFESIRAAVGMYLAPSQAIVEQLLEKARQQSIGLIEVTRYGDIL